MGLPHVVAGGVQGLGAGVRGCVLLVAYGLRFRFQKPAAPVDEHEEVARALEEPFGQEQRARLKEGGGRGGEGSDEGERCVTCDV